MPELGKATYILEVNSAQYNVGFKQAEERAMVSTSKIESSVAKADEAIASMGSTAQAAGNETAAGFEKAGAGAQAGASQVQAASARAGGAAKAAAAGTAAGFAEAGKRMSSLGKTLTHKVTLPGLVIGGFAVKSALDYTEKIKLLQIQAGATSREAEHIGKSIKDFVGSGQSIAGPRKVADAMFLIESSGLRGAKAMEVMKAAEDGAMVGSAQLTTVTEALTSAVNTKIKGVKNASDAMGYLNAIVGQGKMRMEDLAGTFGTGVYAAAKLTGLGIADVGAALDIFTRRGVPAQEAGTRMKLMLFNMFSPTQKATKALKELGIEHDDLAKMMRGPKGLPGSIEYIAKKMQTLAKKEGDPLHGKQLIVQAFGGARSGATILQLIQAYKELKEARDAVEKSKGQFAGSARMAQQEPVQQLRAAWAQLQVKLIDLGDKLIPLVIKIARAGTMITTVFTKIPSSIRGVVASLALLAIAAGPALRLVGALARGFTLLGLAGPRAAAGARAAAAGETAAGAAATVATGRVARLRGALLGLAGKVFIATLILSIIPRSKKGQNILDQAGLGWAGRLPVVGGLATQGARMGNTVRGWLGKDKFDDNGPDKPSTAHDLYVEEVRRNLAAGMPEKRAKREAALTVRRSFPNFWPTSGVGPAPGKKKGGAGGGGGDGGGGGNEPPKDALGKGWTNLDIEYQRALRTKSTKDDDAMLSKEEAYLRARLHTPNLTMAQKDQLEGQLTGVIQQRQSLKDAAKGAAGTDGKDWLTPSMRIRQTKAERTKTLRDDIAVQRAEKHAIEAQLRHTKNMQKRADLEEQLTGIETKLKDLRKQEIQDKEANHKATKEDLKALQDLRGTFFGQFASNVFHKDEAGKYTPGGKTMHYTQHNTYHEIPKDRHHEARRQRQATAGAWD